MRTLKFRVFDLLTNTMLYDDKPEGFCFDYKNHTGQIMQFTGLRDKNGKEIFEGDIVKHQWNGCEEEGPFIVESLEWAYIENRNEKNGKLTCISEIIGNIYENPSLLKDTQHE